MDPYAVLGVARGADRATVRRAYLRLARQHHPDAHAGGSPAERAEAESRMREINEAWSLLSPGGGDGPVGTPDPARAPGAGVVRDPGGPGWRPTASDTGWMDDFEAWKHDQDDLVPPDPSVSPVRSLLTVLPVGVFVLAVVVGSVGMVLDEPTVVAVSLALVVISAALFVAVPLLLMIRRRPD